MTQLRRYLLLFWSTWRQGIIFSLKKYLFSTHVRNVIWATIGQPRQFCFSAVPVRTSWPRSRRSWADRLAWRRCSGCWAPAPECPPSYRTWQRRGVLCGPPTNQCCGSAAPIRQDGRNIVNCTQTKQNALNLDLLNSNLLILVLVHILFKMKIILYVRC